MIQAKLPPGFTTHDPELTDDGWFQILFDYCDRHHSLCILLKGYDLASLTEAVTEQIEMTPAMERPPEETVAAIVRLRRLKHGGK